MRRRPHSDGENFWKAGAHVQETACVSVGHSVLAYVGAGRGQLAKCHLKINHAPKVHKENHGSHRKHAQCRKHHWLEGDREARSSQQTNPPNKRQPPLRVAFHRAHDISTGLSNITGCRVCASRGALWRWGAWPWERSRLRSIFQRTRMFSCIQLNTSCLSGFISQSIPVRARPILRKLKRLSTDAAHWFQGPARGIPDSSYLTANRFFV